MTEDETMLVQVKEARDKQRKDRRDFFRTFGVAAVAAGGAAYALKGSNALAQEAPTDLDILNFALNLEYLEANYYHLGVFGEPIPAEMTTGTGTPGDVMGGAKVDFSNAPPVLEPIFREIAADELAHVQFLRDALGDNAVAQPRIDLRQAADGPFSTLARAANIDLSNTNGELPVYGDFKDFVLGAFVFEDVGVTAYKGAAPLITDKESYLGAAAGILAVEAYHASIIRTTLYNGPDPYPEYADKISDARDSVDGDSDLDQGISATNNADGDPVSNIVPLDDNGRAFSRSAAQVLNVVYLNNAAVQKGGFFPDGVNGTINMSADNTNGNN